MNTAIICLRALRFFFLLLLFPACLSAFAAPANDDFADAQLVTPSLLPLEISGTTIDATSETEEPWGLDNTVWHKFTAPEEGWYQVDVESPESLVNVDAFQGFTIGGLYPFQNGINNRNRPVIFLYLSANEFVYLRVGSTTDAEAGSNFLLSIDLLDFLPVHVTGISYSVDTVDVTNADQPIVLNLEIRASEPLIAITAALSHTFWNNFPEIGRTTIHHPEPVTVSPEGVATYSIPLQIPQYAPPGTWKAFILISDTEGFLYELVDKAGYEPALSQQYFEVTNDGVVDVTPPTLDAFEMTPSAVDVATTEKSVAVRLSYSDDFSGMAKGSSFLAGFHTWASGETWWHLNGPLNASHSFSFDVPTNAVTGSHPFQIQLEDRVGNSAYYLAGWDEGLPQGANGTLRITNDGTPPSLPYDQFLAANPGLTNMKMLRSADADQDGKSNLLELLHGTDPLVPDAGISNARLVPDDEELILEFHVSPEYLTGSSGSPIMFEGLLYNADMSKVEEPVPAQHVSGDLWRIAVPRDQDQKFLSLQVSDPNR